MKRVTIVGGGLAGLTLGIGLRRRGIPVTVWEAGRYPRHRVCGEFISGGGLAALERLGLVEPFIAAGAFRARTAAFFCGTNRSPVRTLPAAALCLSRYLMDALLAETFERLGGDLRKQSRWTAAPGQDGVVWAAGRRARPAGSRWRWFGMKIHANRCPELKLAADLELHFSGGGYVGVNRVDHGEINICGLFRIRPGDAPPRRRLEWLGGEPGSVLHQRLQGAQFDESSFCSVAGLSPEGEWPGAWTRNAECRIGDALTMTPPVTGNGMSMAFESAGMAIEPLAAYSQGRIAWEDAQRRVAGSCAAAFTNRLQWARRLQWLLFSPLFRGRIGALLLDSQSFWNWIFDKTRS